MVERLGKRPTDGIIKLALKDDKSKPSDHTHTFNGEWRRSNQR
jgi:hypothetical protein